MVRKQEIEAHWAELFQRLQDDPNLFQVVEDLDRALEDIAAEQRPRLKVPYANATSLDDSPHWD
jgi:hypothetical protein